jgi:hypothetical protein
LVGETTAKNPPPPNYHVVEFSFAVTV